MANVVAAPPTLLVKIPPTASVVLGESVKLEALVREKLLVVVAFAVIVQPPEEELRVRL